MSAKVILVTVNSKRKNYGATAENLSAVAPNIPLGLLGTYLNESGIWTEVIDSDIEGFTIQAVIESLLQDAPVLVGVYAGGANPSASTMSMVGVIEFFQALKNEKDVPFKTFVWGGHPTVLAERTLRETGSDYVVRGEGYKQSRALVDHITNGKSLSEVPGIAYLDDQSFKSTPMPDLIELDSLPFVDWKQMNPSKLRAHNWHCFGEDINNRSPYAIIWTNQGCPYPCDFCSINNVFGARRYRFRSMERVVEEIDNLVNNFGVKHLKILDELFITKHKRIEEFCDLLEERNYDLNMWCFARVDSVNPEILQRLKGVGLNWVAYGFESNDEKIVEATNKRCKADVSNTIRMTRDAGIYICADVIVGLWEDDRSSVKRTRDFLVRHEMEWVNIYPGFGYPGTPLYDRYLTSGVIDEPSTWDTYGLYSIECNPLPTRYLSSSEVLQLRDEMFSEYYKDPQILNMLEGKFGYDTRQHVEKMVEKPLPRRILEPGSEHLAVPAGGVLPAGSESHKITNQAMVI